MSSEELTQDQIDELLDAGSESRVADRTRRDARSSEAALYDFRRPHRVSKERSRTLEAMYERLVKSLEGWLMGRVRGQIELTLRGVEQQSLSDFLSTLSTPCCSYMLDIRDAGGQPGLIDFGRDFASFLVDRLLGGRGTGYSMQRALTPIERMIVRTVAERIGSSVREIWEDYLPLDLAVAGFESVPEILGATYDDAPVLVATVDVKAAGQSTVVAICLPFAVLDSFFADAVVHRRNTVSGSDDERRLNRLVVENSLRATELPVAARLPEFRITMKSLIALRPGEMLSTGISRNSEIELVVGSHVRFLGRPARVGKRLAISITESVVEAAQPVGPGEGMKLLAKEN